MASFPTSVKVFTSKVAGNVIQPVDCNDLQDEVNAIEAGYLNGTANLNSSNSTVANLSVLGNSTIAGSLTVSSNITVGGGLTFSSVVTNAGQPRCRVYNNSSQTLSSNGDTVLTFNTQDFNVGSLHSTASNPTRITVQSTGVWLFGAGARTQIANTVGGSIRFRKNGATQVGGQFGYGNCPTGPQWMRIHAIDHMTSTGDYMEVIVNQGGAAAVESGNASSRVDQNEFFAVKLW